MSVIRMNDQRRVSETLRITEMLSSDIPAVALIEQESNPEPWSHESFLEELIRPHSFLLVARLAAKSGEMVVGFLCFWLVADEIQILNIAVHPAYRRQGVGHALLCHCLNYGAQRRCLSAVLEVRSSNLVAQHLYTSLGFRVVGQRKDYYGCHKEPALLMELSMAREHLRRWSNGMGKPSLEV